MNRETSTVASSAGQEQEEGLPAGQSDDFSFACSPRKERGRKGSINCTARKAKAYSTHAPLLGELSSDLQHTIINFRLLTDTSSCSSPLYPCFLSSPSTPWSKWQKKQQEWLHNGCKAPRTPSVHLATGSPFFSPGEPLQSGGTGSLNHCRARQSQSPLQHSLPLPQGNHFPYTDSLICSWLNTPPHLLGECAHIHKHMVCSWKEKPQGRQSYWCAMYGRPPAEKAPILKDKLLIFSIRRSSHCLR